MITKWSIGAASSCLSIGNLIQSNLITSAMRIDLMKTVIQMTLSLFAQIVNMCTVKINSELLSGRFATRVIQSLVIPRKTAIGTNEASTASSGWVSAISL